jgi:hypothetical protein
MGWTRPFPLLQMLRSFSVLLLPYSGHGMFELPQKLDKLLLTPSSLFDPFGSCERHQLLLPRHHSNLCLSHQG